MLLPVYWPTICYSCHQILMSYARQQYACKTDSSEAQTWCKRNVFTRCYYFFLHCSCFSVHNSFTHKCHSINVVHTAPHIIELECCGKMNPSTTNYQWIYDLLNKVSGTYCLSLGCAIHKIYVNGKLRMGVIEVLFFISLLWIYTTPHKTYRATAYGSLRHPSQR